MNKLNVNQEECLLLVHNQCKAGCFFIPLADDIYVDCLRRTVYVHGPIASTLRALERRELINPVEFGLVKYCYSMTDKGRVLAEGIIAEIKAGNRADLLKLSNVVDDNDGDLPEVEE